MDEVFRSPSLTRNKRIFGSEIIDYTTNSTRRIEKTFRVDNKCDIEEVRKIIKTTLSEYPLVLKEPPIFVKLMGMDNCLEFEVRVWVKTENYFEVLLNISEMIIIAFKANGIIFPNSYIDVNMIRQENNIVSTDLVSEGKGRKKATKVVRD